MIGAWIESAEKGHERDNMQQIKITYHSPARQKSRDYIYGVCKSRFGDCVLIGDMTDAPSIAGLGFCHKSLGETYDNLRDKNFRGIDINCDEKAIAKLARCLPDRHTSAQAPIILSLTGTRFQHKVWRALCDIKTGEKRDYKYIADRLSSSPRAVGGALGANPIAWLVPCHRVLSVPEKLHGYRWGLSVKEKLLRAENITYT